MIEQYIIRNRYKAIFASILFGTLFTACVDDNGLNNENVSDQPTIQLRLSTDDMTTRAVTGESAFTVKEKKMNTVDIYFFSNEATEATTALKWVRITDKKHNDEETIKIPRDSIPVVFGSENKCRVYAVVNVSPDDFKAANVSQVTPTLKQLRELRAKTPSFAEKFDGFAMFTKNENGDELTYNETSREANGMVKVKNLASKIDIFVSFGDDNGMVEGTDPTGTLPGVLKWKIYDGTINEAYIIDGVQTVPLNGWTDQDYSGGKLTAELSGDDYFDTRTSTANHFFEASTEADSQKYPWVIADPFYSYPNQWSNDALEQHQTYLMVKVSWLPYETAEDAPDVNDQIVETYYRIPFNVADGTTIKSKDKLLSNVYYRVKVNINTMGGANYGEPVDLTDCSWEALDWGSARLDAEVHEIRWLEITQKQKDPYDGKTYQAIMENTSSVTLSYNSTHSIFLKSIKIQYYNFLTSTPELVSVLAFKVDGKKADKYDSDLKNAGIDENVFLLDDEKLKWFKEKGEEPNGFYIDETNRTVTFYHSVYPLSGDNKTPGLPGKGKYYGVYTKVGDKTYSPFYVEFTLAHVDKPEFEKTYTIKQNPGVYVEFSANSGMTINEEGKWVSIGRRVSNGAGGSSGDNGRRFGVYINGGATYYFSDFSANDASNSLQFGGIGGTGRNSNNNMYVIHATQLSDDEIVRFSFGGDVVSAQTKDVKFHIGDPRAKHINNNLSGDADLTDLYDITDGWSATSYSGTNKDSRNAFRRDPATAIWDNKRGYSQRWYAPKNDNSSLTYYYPTAEGQSDEEAFMISPVFRLAGGNTDVFIGGTNGAPSEFFGTDRTTEDLLRENARRRCAALQNSGYPAGRWRLPTIGEALFFKFLQDKKVLPIIFADEDKAIWTAQYLFKFNKNGYDVRTYKANDDLHKWVRCVYDDWYWVDENGDPEVITRENTTFYNDYSTDGDIREMFVWGDKEKNNPQQQP